MIALSVGFGALVTLALANRLLMALDDDCAASRAALDGERRNALSAETAWLIRDTAEKGLVFERDRAEWEYSVN